MRGAPVALAIQESLLAKRLCRRSRAAPIIQGRDVLAAGITDQINHPAANPSIRKIRRRRQCRLQKRLQRRGQALQVARHQIIRRTGRAGLQRGGNRRRIALHQRCRMYEIRPVRVRIVRRVHNVNRIAHALEQVASGRLELRNDPLAARRPVVNTVRHDEQKFQWRIRGIAITRRRHRMRQLRCSIEEIGIGMGAVADEGIRLNAGVRPVGVVWRCAHCFLRRREIVARLGAARRIVLGQFGIEVPHTDREIIGRYVIPLHGLDDLIYRRLYNVEAQLDRAIAQNRASLIAWSLANRAACQRIKVITGAGLLSIRMAREGARRLSVRPNTIRNLLRADNIVTGWAR